MKQIRKREKEKMPVLEQTKRHAGRVQRLSREFTLNLLMSVLEQ